MLSDQNAVFKQTVKQCSEQAMYQALYKAMMATFDEDSTDTGEDKAKVDNQRMKMADAFAKAGKDAFSENFVDMITTAIDAYIRSIGITIVCPVPSTTVLTSPLGPVSGTISILPSNTIIS